jgi:apolipoprotein D and lipocalin family protein
MDRLAARVGIAEAAVRSAALGPASIAPTRSPIAGIPDGARASSMRCGGHRPRRPVRSLLLASVLLLGACAASNQAPLPTVGAVDLTRYMGTWYEIAMLPNWFQRQCVADTQAHYRLDGDGVEVVNTCRKADGGAESAVGHAHAVEASGNAKLRVSFFRPFYGDYWVLALDPSYSSVLVGEPGRRHAWILARSPELDAAALEALLVRAQELGFDRTAFRLTPQHPAARPAV